MYLIKSLDSIKNMERNNTTLFDYYDNDIVLLFFFKVIS